MPTLLPRLLLAPTRSVFFQNKLLLSSYSRMLDMGGAPSSLHDRSKSRINASKNCQVQAVCFDFDVLTRSMSERKEQAEKTSRDGALETPPSAALGQQVQPNTSMIQEVAGLLNIDLSGKDGMIPARSSPPPDDLSALRGTKETTSAAQPVNFPSNDPRAKYLAKLQRKGVDGLAGVERAKSQLEDSRGDAAGHWAARKRIAAEQPPGAKWMAQTGTGQLLQYLSQRSMKLCLLPKPSSVEETTEGKRMEEFQRQLSGVVLDLLLQDGSIGVPELLQTTLQTFALDPTLVLVVSDRDDYIRTAKELGMVTCRIRPLHARRGNVSAHYMVTDVPEVKDVVDEINGISFNAVIQSQ